MVVFDWIFYISYPTLFKGTTRMNGLKITNASPDLINQYENTKRNYTVAIEICTLTRMPSGQHKPKLCQS